MFLPRRWAASTLLRSEATSALTKTRHASLASAINRGIRKTNDRSDRLGSTSRENDNSRNRKNAASSAANAPPPRSRLELGRHNDAGTSNRIKAGSKAYRDKNKSRIHANTVSTEAPLGKPYTTAGSEFLYGTFAVRAALQAKRRKLYKLYVWKGERSDAKEKDEDSYDRSIHVLAKEHAIPTQFVSGPSWEKMLMRMSNQRPHNGYVLESSAIPKLPATSLQRVEQPSDEIMVSTSIQSREDEEINTVFERYSSTITTGSSSLYKLSRNGIRSHYPLLLWLDRITDTGNLGAIMRTAHFMGVDGIIIPEHGTAPFSPVTIKASAGAAEQVPVLVVRRELSFIQACQENGWKFVAAVAPNSASTWKSLSQQGSFVAETALEHNPCVLMVGNEGEGLRPAIQKAADNFVSIRGVRGPADGIDSLNVSVAAALLTARLLSRASLSSSSIPNSQKTVTGSASSTKKDKVESRSESEFRSQSRPRSQQDQEEQQDIPDKDQVKSSDETNTMF